MNGHVDLVDLIRREEDCVVEVVGECEIAGDPQGFEEILLVTEGQSPVWSLLRVLTDLIELFLFLLKRLTL